MATDAQTQTDETETETPQAAAEAPTPVPPVTLTLEARHLRAAFAAVGQCVAKKSPKPVLQSVLLEAEAGGSVTLSATDLMQAVRVTLPVPSSDVSARLLLPFARFQAILAKTEKEPTITLEVTREGSLAVRGLHFKFVLPLDDPALYPDLPRAPADAGWHRTSAADLRTLIKRTRYATDVESTRYALGGTLLDLGDDKVTMVATDGRRMAMQVVPAEAINGGGLDATAKKMPAPVLPVKALVLLERVLPEDDGALAEVHVQGNTAAFVRSGDVRLYTRLVEGRFPRYQDVLPGQHVVRLEMAAEELAETLEIASVTTSDESRGVDFELADGRLTLKATACDVGSSEADMPVFYSGKPLEWTLDPRFTLEGLKSLPGDSVLELDLIDGKNAVVFRLGRADGSDRQFTYVIMPLTRDR
jgi:DNA polymerase-3 subunit beta